MSRLFQGDPRHADEYQKQQFRKRCITGVVAGLHLLFLSVPVVSPPIAMSPHMNSAIIVQLRNPKSS